MGVRLHRQNGANPSLDAVDLQSLLQFDLHVFGQLHDLGQAVRGDPLGGASRHGVPRLHRQHHVVGGLDRLDHGERLHLVRLHVGAGPDRHHVAGAVGKFLPDQGAKAAL